MKIKNLTMRGNFLVLAVYIFVCIFLNFLICVAQLCHFSDGLVRAVFFQFLNSPSVIFWEKVLTSELLGSTVVYIVVIGGLSIVTNSILLFTILFSFSKLIVKFKGNERGQPQGIAPTKVNSKNRVLDV